MRRRFILRWLKGWLRRVSSERVGREDQGLIVIVSWGIALRSGRGEHWEMGKDIQCMGLSDAD
jgi:hypothetical protein